MKSSHCLILLVQRLFEDYLNTFKIEWCHNTGTTRIDSAINNPAEYSVGTIINIPLYNNELMYLVWRIHLDTPLTRYPLRKIEVVWSGVSISIRHSYYDTTLYHRYDRQSVSEWWERIIFKTLNDKWKKTSFSFEKQKWWFLALGEDSCCIYGSTLNYRNNINNEIIVYR